MAALDAHTPAGPHGRAPVMHVISGLRTGGAERALYRLVERGLARTFDTHVVSLEDEGTIGVPLRTVGATVHVLAARRNPIAAAARLRRLVRTIRPALIQGWMYHGNVGAELAARFGVNRTPTLWNIRQGLDDFAVEKPLTRHFIRLNRTMSRRPVGILYNSHRSRLQHEAFGLATEHGRVIPNGFDLDRFKPDADARRQIRAELGIDEAALLVGHFARLHPMKDHAGLLTAANMAFRDGLDAHFLLTGQGVSAASIGLDHLVDPPFRARFHIFGDRADVPALMQAIDIYVSSSSRAEGFPNVIGEAMASARPCIGTDIGDTARVIGEAGIVVPPSDPAALAMALVELCSRSDRRRALGDVGKSAMEAAFKIETIVDQYVALYQSVIAGSKEAA